LKGRVRSYWKKKQPRLARLLQYLPPGLRFLGLTLYRHTRPPGFEVRAALHLPTGTLVAEETATEVLVTAALSFRASL
jgi:hypothetical protein